MTSCIVEWVGGFGKLGLLSFNRLAPLPFPLKTWGPALPKIVFITLLEITERIADVPVRPQLSLLA